MTTTNQTTITVETTVNAPIEKVWSYWNEPAHITQWNTPSPDWHSPRAQNDLRPGGKLFARMEAKDGSFGFDFEGIYSEVVTNKRIAYAMSDGRKVEVVFTPDGATTKVTETFDPETENTLELQRAGWQAILDSFKKHTESN